MSSIDNKAPTEREIELAQDWAKRPHDNPNFKLAIARLLAEYRCELIQAEADRRHEALATHQAAIAAARRDDGTFSSLCAPDLKPRDE